MSAFLKTARVGQKLQGGVDVGKDVVFLPIEPMTERYSEQMLGWVKSDLVSCANPPAKLETVLPWEGTITIRRGPFLDFTESNRWKASQLALVCGMFDRLQIGHGTVFLVGDMWFPGISMIRHMADLFGVEIKIVGWNYAGLSDPTDFYTAVLDHSWAVPFERALFDLFDTVIVGSRHHQEQIARMFGNHDVRPIGLVWHPSEVKKHATAKEKIVVFPHRLTIDKRPDVFFTAAETLHNEFGDWRWVVSTNSRKTISKYVMPPCVEMIVNDSKTDYYDLLGISSICFSSAIHETFGYAINEAIACGCSVVAPNRLSYPEVLENDRRFLYDQDDPSQTEPAIALLRERMKEFVPVPYSATAKYEHRTRDLFSGILK